MFYVDSWLTNNSIFHSFKQEYIHVCFLNFNQCWQFSAKAANEFQPHLSQLCFEHTHLNLHKKNSNKNGAIDFSITTDCVASQNLCEAILTTIHFWIESLSLISYQKLYQKKTIDGIHQLKANYIYISDISLITK